MSPVKVKSEREVLWSSFFYFGDFEYPEWRARISKLAVIFLHKPAWYGTLYELVGRIIAVSSI